MIPLLALALMIYSWACSAVLPRRGNVQLGHETEWLNWSTIRIVHPDVSVKLFATHRKTQRLPSMCAIALRSTPNHLHSVGKLIFLNTLVAAAPNGSARHCHRNARHFCRPSSSGGAETVDIVAAGICEGLITTQTVSSSPFRAFFWPPLIRRRMHAIEAALARIESLA